MTGGKKLTIALAIAIPVLILGGGLALAAGDAPDLKSGNEAAPSSAVAPVSSVSTVSTPYDSCDGDCTSIGDCSGLCDGDCDGPCAGACSAACDKDCDGTCAGLREGNGPCNGTGASASCTAANAACVGGGTGNCGGTAALRGRGCGGGTCSQPASAVEVVRPACGSCDVAGLNEYPVNSPNYKATV